jgi:peroxiredoxin
MIKKIIGAAALLILIAVAIVSTINNDKDKPSSNKAEAAGGLEIGVKAPDFELVTLEGKKVKLSDYRGKKVLLNFWATWCPPCKKEMPDMEKLHEKAGDELVILAVNNDPENNVKGFAKEMGVTFPILLDNTDAKKSITDKYRVQSIPTTFFVDKDGIIQNKFLGAMTLEFMELNVNKLH